MIFHRQTSLQVNLTWLAGLTSAATVGIIGGVSWQRWQRQKRGIYMVFIWCLYGVYRGFICFFLIYGGLMWFKICFYGFLGGVI